MHIPYAILFKHLKLKHFNFRRLSLNKMLWLLVQHEQNFSPKMFQNFTKLPLTTVDKFYFIIVIINSKIKRKVDTQLDLAVRLCVDRVPRNRGLNWRLSKNESIVDMFLNDWKRSVQSFVEKFTITNFSITSGQRENKTPSTEWRVYPGKTVAQTKGQPKYEMQSKNVNRRPVVVLLCSNSDRWFRFVLEDRRAFVRLDESQSTNLVRQPHWILHRSPFRHFQRLRWLTHSGSVELRCWSNFRTVCVCDHWRPAWSLFRRPLSSSWEWRKED